MEEEEPPTFIAFEDLQIFGCAFVVMVIAVIAVGIFIVMRHG